MGALNVVVLGLLLVPSAMSKGLIGYGISMYEPNCAFACRSSLSNAMLSCTKMHVGGKHYGGDAPTSPGCYAGDTPWLTTLAYCINDTCSETISPWMLEKYWSEECTGDASVQPKWTFQETLEQLKHSEFPTRYFLDVGEHETLNDTVFYDKETWESFRGTLWAFEDAETMHSRTAIALLVISLSIPILLSFLTRLPFMTTAIATISPYIITPSLLSTHVQSLRFNLGNAPTLGQALYITIFIILNILLTAIGYQSFQSNQYFSTPWQEIISYTGARTGVISAALIPLVILFAGRNNVLLWLTNWSHATYMLLHRWAARIFTLHVILHSILEFMLYKDKGTVAEEQFSSYWIWGVVATLTCCVMVVISTLWFRRLSYEIFLILHIILAIFVIVGTWYHIDIRFNRSWGYECWIYAACAVWFFDRLMRVGKVLKNGVRKSEVVQVADDIFRIDIKGVMWDAQPGRHTYAYFPTMNPLRPWENHPFSVIPTSLLRSRGHSLDTVSSHASQHSARGRHIEKAGVSATTVAMRAPIPKGISTSGISLYVRKSKGLTHALASHASLTTLLDGPYPNNDPSSVLKSDRLVLIAGGIGVTGVLPFIAHHQNVKLYWSIKASSQGLVEDLADVLKVMQEKEVQVGRVDIEALVKSEEDMGWKRVGVVVCGPGGMCDQVRRVVSGRGRQGKVRWELDVEAFSW